MHITRRGTQARQIREAPYWKMWSLAQTLVFLIGIHQQGYQGNANPSSPDVSLASASLITSTNWQTKTNLGSNHLPILISLQMDHTINPIPHRTSFNLKKANWDRYSKEIEDKLSKRRLPSNCQKGEKILRTIILKAASRHIPSGRHRINTEPVPTTPACTWWNRPEEDLSSGKSESTHPSRTVVQSIEVFYGVESVVRGNADSLLN